MIFGIVDELRTRINLLDESIATLQRKVDAILARLEQLVAK